MKPNGGSGFLYGALASMNQVKELTPDQIDAKRAAMRDEMERTALTLELIDARRRLLGAKVDRDWERQLIEKAIRDIDPSPEHASYASILNRLWGAV